MQYAYQFELIHKKEIEALLAKDPYADDSFSRLGYIVKESNALGLKGEHLIIYFKTQDDTLAKKLVEQLKTVPTCVELGGNDREKVANIIEAEENRATSGFGAIFG